MTMTLAAPPRLVVKVLPSLREEWLGRLRSGRDERCAGVLRQDDSLCALGVLADVMVRRGIGSWEISPVTKFTPGVYSFVHESSLYDSILPDRLLRRVGLGLGQASWIALMNDRGETWSHIAHLVEAEPGQW